MRLRSVLILLFALPLLGWAPSALAVDACEDEARPADERIAACTEQITAAKTTGMFTPRSLAWTFSNRGVAWKDKGDSDRAIADFGEAILLSPQFAVAFNNRGAVWRQKGDSARALGDYSEAIRLEPELGAAYYNRAIEWLAQRDDDRANADFGKAIRLDSKLAVNALIGRGLVWRRKGDSDRAIADLDEAIRLAPNSAEGFLQRSRAWQDKRVFDKALADLETAARLNPQRRGAMLRALGRLRFDRGQFAESAKVLSEEVAQRPTYPYAAIWLYLAQARAGDESGARTQLSARRASYSSDTWPAHVMDYYAGVLDADALFAAADRAQSSKPAGQRCEANFYAGEWQLLRGNIAAARRLFEAVKDDCPPSFDELAAASAELASIDTPRSVIKLP